MAGAENKRSNRSAAFLQTKLHDIVAPEPVGRPLLINMHKISVEATFNLVRHRTQL
jgi:hypothetical protein